MRDSRRRFLKATAAVLVVGIDPPRVLAADAPPPADPYIRIEPSGRVTLVTPKVEMGQGQWTTWAMVVADGLGVPLSAVRVVAAPADPRLYRDPLLEKQATYGSTGISAYIKPLREATALARARMPAGSAAPAPVVGTRVARVDTPEKCDGRARFGIDTAMPGMRTAVLVAAPRSGLRAKVANAKAMEGRAGVERVLPVTGGVAIVARDFWSAKRARRSLQVSWEGPPPVSGDEATLRAEYAKRLDEPGVVVSRSGDIAAAEGEIAVTADYDAPFIAHLPMEPLNCTAHHTPDKLELWVGTQDAEQALKVAREATGLAADRIHIHTPLLGGGFGRRAATDFILPAIEAAVAIGHPVKLVIEREDELRLGHFRPAAAARLTAAVKDGRITRLQAKTVCASVSKPFFGGNQKNKEGAEYDFFAVQGMGMRAWRIPAREVRWVEAASPFPVWIWRGVGYSQNVFFVESFVDELALAAKADPLDFRLAHASEPRMAKALEAAARESGWRTPPAAGRARGVAAFLHEKLVHVLVAEVSIANGRPRVHRVTSVVDCGRVVNPDAVEAQCQGGVMMGLSEALGGAVRFRDGAVMQSNFHDYPVLRLADAPAMTVHLLQGMDEVQGVGEFTNVLVAPAVANALAALTGRRLRSLPLAQDPSRA
jgi:isoquinoline 1-oxidoreductase beta subunit